MLRASGVHGGREQGLCAMPFETSDEVEYANRAEVFPVEECRLRLIDFHWPLVARHGAQIDRHWDESTRENPALFDGQILMVSEMQRDGDALELSLFATRFRNYLYWRHTGFADGSVIDGFGSGVIRSADGALLLVRQRAGFLNEGLFYFPGGFIDPRDVDAAGAIDIAASVMREVGEETGLSAGDVQRVAGFTVVRRHAQIAIAVSFRSDLEAEPLARRIREHCARQADAEIEEVRAVRNVADVAGIALAPYCRLLLPHLLGAAIFPGD